MSIELEEHLALACGEQGVQDPGLEGLHSPGRRWLLVVMAEEVEDAMGDEECYLTLDRVSILAGLLAGTGIGDDDLAQVDEVVRRGDKLKGGDNWA